MAGERYAKITIRAAWSWVANTRGRQTEEVRFKLGGVWETYRRGPNPANNEFVVPDPADPGVGRLFVMQGVANLVSLLRTTMLAKALYYTVSPLRDAGDDSSHVGQGNGVFTEVNPWPIVEFDITARIYDSSYDLDFADFSSALQSGLGGWLVVSNVSTIKPVFVTPQVTDAVIYNSATGAITLVASGGIGLYSYAWADPGAPVTATRTNLVGPADYTCTVSDYSGSSTTVTVHVGSDPRLDATVQQIANNVTVIASGGVGPYTYLWSDGPTTDVRPGLAAGTYDCTVTDSHGATVTVTVTIEAFNRFYFSRNPVVLELAANNLATKPNLRFLCQVWVEPDYLSGVFVNIAGELTQPADSAGRTSFDVSTLLDAYVQPDWPAHGSAGVQLASQCFKRFYLQHSEQWDGSPTPAYTVRATHYLVYGGLDFYEYAADSYFRTYRPQVHPFLTWEPVQKEVFADQPEYLYYQHDSLIDATFTVQVTCISSTGTRTSQVLRAATGVQCFEVWRLGVGLAQLRASLPVDPPRDTVAWEVVVQNAAGTDASETRYYQLSEELPARRRYFLYANSIGGINTLASQGKAKTDLALTSTQVLRSLQPGYKGDDGEAFTTNVAGVPTLTCNTGQLTPEQLEAFQDFLLSEEIRYYDTDRYRPGSLVAADTLPLADDDAGLIQQDFAFVLPTRRRYTPTLPLQ